MFLAPLRQKIAIIERVWFLRYNKPMFSSFFHAAFYDPIYNGLVFLVAVVPGADVGIAVILLTIVVRLILFPLSLKAIRTQLVMKQLAPELERIKKEYADKREEQARQTMALYKKEKVNPFSSFGFLIIQLVFIIALYLVFFNGGLPSIQTELLYSFTPIPDTVNMHFLGFLDVAGKSLVLAFLAGITQFIQTRLSLPPMPPKKEGAASFKDDLARSFNLQMRYILPIIIFFVAYSISAAIALYFTVSNLVSIGQELYVRRTLKRPAA